MSGRPTDKSMLEDIIGPLHNLKCDLERIELLLTPWQHHVHDSNALEALDDAWGLFDKTWQQVHRYYKTVSKRESK